jgi:hypothetical protein
LPDGLLLRLVLIKLPAWPQRLRSNVKRADSRGLLRVSGERDDLKSLLVATLQRLEAVDRVVARADDSNAAMEERISVLEEERNKALDAATSAQARVEALQKSQRRIEWQNKVHLVLLVQHLPAVCKCTFPPLTN